MISPPSEPKSDAAIATAPTEIRIALNRLVQFCEKQRLAMKDEKIAQQQMEERLLAAGYSFQREHRLSPNDIPDFLISIPDGWSIVLEMKTRAKRMQVYRQLERYSLHENVHGILLLSATAMILPEEINGKPAARASMGSAWI